MKFEPALISDKSYFKDLNRACYTEVVGRQFGPWDEQLQSENFELKWLEQNFQKVFVNDELVGGVWLDEEDYVIQLRELQIDPNYQSKGIGSEVLFRQMEFAQKEGKPMRLRVLTMSNAVALYQRAGFRIVDQNDHQHIMQHDLRQPIIRPARQDDEQVFNRDVKNSYGRSYADEWQDMQAGEHSIFVAWLKGEIVGSGFVRWLGPRDEKAFSLWPKAPEVLRLNVNPEVQSLGIGSRLISAMEVEAKRRGFPSISLGVAHDNERAYQLYLRLGYGDTELTSYRDEYQYPTPGGGVALASEVCRYLVKPLSELS